MTYRVDLFWCCLNPAEKQVASACLFAFRLFTGYITKQAYDLVWLTSGAKSLLPRKSAFASIYGLEEGVIFDSEGNPTEVYFLVGNFWFDLNAYYETTLLICNEPCRELTYSNAT